MALTKKIFLTGATGFVGKNLLPKLLEKNFKVILLVRNMEDESIHLPHANLAVYQGVFEDKNLLEKVTQECQAIIHLAAVIKGTNYEEFYKVNVLGTRNLLEAAKFNKVKKIVYLSTDKSDKDAVDPYGRTKYEAEQLIVKSGLDYTILKCPTIYGQGDKVLTRLFKLIKISSVMPILGSGEYKLQPVYIDDVCEALIKSIGNSKTQNKTYWLAAPKPVSFSEFVDLVASKFNKKIFKIFLPTWLVNFLPGGLKEQFRHLAKGNTFNIKPFINDFQFTPQDISEGIELTIKQRI